MDLATTSALQDAVLDRYCWNDRQSKVWAARAAALAAAGNSEGAGKALQKMAEALMPELAKKVEEFRDTASRVMPTWRDRVFVIQRAPDGAPTISAHKSTAVESELLEFAQSKRGPRPADRGRHRRMIQRQRLHQTQAPRPAGSIPPTPGRGRR